jgi:hypothetical protein
MAQAQEVLKLFEQDPRRTFRLCELVLGLGRRLSRARELKSLLEDLARSRKLVYLKKNHCTLLYKGRHAASETVAAVPRLRDRRLAGHRPPLRSGESLRDGGHRPPLQGWKSPNFVSLEAGAPPRLRACATNLVSRDAGGVQSLRACATSLP